MPDPSPATPVSPLPVTVVKSSPTVNWAGLTAYVHIALLYTLLGFALATGMPGCPSPIPPKPVPTPTPIPVPPKPVNPDWNPEPRPPLPTPTPLQWRPLPFAPGWDGLGRDVDGRFMIETWRRSNG